MLILGENEMDNYIEHLQNIQEDLVGIIIPVVITAIISAFKYAISNRISKEIT